MVRLVVVERLKYEMKIFKLCQAGLIGVQILWTNEAELAIKKSKVDKEIMRKTNQQFLDLLNEFIELTLTDLSKLQRIKYETMVTIHVHQVNKFIGFIVLCLLA